MGLRNSFRGQTGFVQIFLLLGLVAVAIIAGVFYLGRISNRIVPRLPPLVQPTPTPDETADWKTYTNERYGFELKYPTNYYPLDFSQKFIDRQKGCKEGCGGGPLAEFSLLFSTDKNLTLEQYETAVNTSISPTMLGIYDSSKTKGNFIEVLIGLPVNDEYATFSDITIGGMKGVKKISKISKDQLDRITRVDVAFEKGGKVFLFSAPSNRISELELMLSTFKFTQ